jgi:hypothetical protein
VADNRVIFEVITTSKGTKVVQQQTENLAKSVDKADRSTRNLTGSQDQNYGRQKQGVIQTANSTKNFSKLSQTIGGGSSGLVGAYATLAANVFAASAAFNFLRSSARFDVLSEGITELGNQSGRTLSIMANRLREVTGEAISVEEAFRSAALGISGGFGEEELAGLAKIAKGASIALGRDLGDAFDRLTRGAIKLEPEILDELGIMVRLDEAVDNYATVLGKSATSLTQLERRQAFMNAILEQGEIKFGAIAEKVDTNPYDRLAAAFADLTRNIGGFLNIAIIPFVEGLANNMGMLVGAALLLASTFAKQMVPSLLQGGKAAQEQSKKMAQLARDKRAVAAQRLPEISAEVGLSKVGNVESQKELNAMRESNGQMKVRKSLLDQLKRSRTALAQQVKTETAFGVKLEAQQITQKKLKIALLDEELKRLNLINATQIGGSKAQISAEGADIRGFVQEDIGGILDEGAQRTPLQSIKALPQDMKKIGVSVSAAKETFKEFTEQQGKMGNKVGKGAKALFNLKLMGTAAAGGIRVLGAAFLNAIPIIGQAIFAFSLLKQFLQFLNKNEAVENLKKSLEDLDTVLKGVTEKTKEFNRVNAQVKDPFQRLVAGYTVASGLIDETITKLDEALKKQAEVDAGAATGFTFPEATGDPLDEALAKIDAANQNIAETLGLEVPVNFKVAQQEDLQESPIFKTLAELREGPEIVQDVLNNKLDLNELVQNGASTEEILTAVNTALKETRTDLKDVGPALVDLQNEFKNTENVVGNFFQKAFPKTKFDEVAKQLSSTTNSFNSAIKELGKGMGEGGDAFLKDMDLTNVSDDLAKQFAQATSGAGKNLESLIPQNLLEADDKLLASLKERDDIQATIADREKQMETANEIQAGFLEKQLRTLYENLGATEDQIAANKSLTTEKGKQIVALNEEFNNLQKNARITATLNKAAENRIKLLKGATKFTSALNFTLLEQNKINTRNKNDLEDQIAVFRKRADALDEEGAERAQLEAFILQLTIQKDQAEENILDKFEMQLQLKQASFKILQEELKIEKERRDAILSNTKNELAILQYKRTGSTDLDPEQTFKAEVQAAKNKRDLALEEVKLRMAMLDVEASIIQARLQATAAEIKDKDPQGAALLEKAGRDVVANTGKARAALQASITNISSSFEAEITNAMVKSLSGANTAQAIANVQTLIAERGANAYNKVVSAAGKAAYEEAIAAGVSEETAQVLAKNARAGARDKTGEGSASEARQNAEKITLGDAVSMISPQLEALKELGPEGELVAAATSGVMNIASAFQVLGEEGGSAASKTAAALSIVSSMSSILQANSKAQVAEIDNQIEAEKRRDGKSKESLAKISAMEKKKEALQRKAFEQQKKMKIASALISTAAAIAGQLSADPVGPWNIALAAMMGALGMAQVAAIRKQQFKGGSGDAPAVQNTALTIGSRSNSVDVGQRASAGELSYLRGGRGVGTTANNFTPAAMGRKGYADGSDGIVVGERGPEVISPAAPIDITPNYAMGGQSQNVNFNINAVDAAGVEDVLINQRGNIIRMIREAANENGERFLETIDTQTYGSKT